MTSQISKRGIATAMARMGGAGAAAGGEHGEFQRFFDCIIRRSVVIVA